MTVLRSAHHAHVGEMMYVHASGHRYDPDGPFEYPTIGTEVTCSCGVVFSDANFRLGDPRGQFLAHALEFVGL